ncbi:hypothetical protein Ae168Ps1_1911 [Pseudonocardia sp. Ae168_Ps1]|nr:hypothetical protein Ae150APs1_1912 [Pseudonocardia sp. Ae150A_Ps1]OLL79505.1 hypothetical protein Ae168Ps1_1911 [Pseudonocardia sp. Ae168_Ps1]OLL86355.1 hypothetical protein Ae263Ps1_3410c [Pseudonocardia sp. Ae263_Ps1]
MSKNEGKVAGTARGPVPEENPMLRSVRRLATLTAIGVVAAAATVVGAGAASAQEQPPPIAMISNLTGKSTSVKLDSGFTGALESLGVTPAPFGDASIADGSASFPITGGNVSVYKPEEVLPYVQGRIEHQGSGLTLTKGDTEVTLDNFVIDPDDPAVLTGRVRAGGQTVAESTTLFDLNGSTLKPITMDEAAGTATLTGTTVTLNSGAAEALNGAFSTDALKGGTVIGIATIVVNTTSGEMPMPQGGVETGGGSTSGTDTGLLAAGAVLLAGSATIAVAVRRRSGSQG